MVTIETLKDANDSAIQDINKLLPQLRSEPSEHKGTLSELQSMVGDKNVALIVARDGERIIGMATLYMITKFSKRSGFVEDVVVDEGHRGQKLGEKIMAALIDAAREDGVQTLYLTSRPERVAANKLYQKLGFELKETNCYRLRLHV